MGYPRTLKNEIPNWEASNQEIRLNQPTIPDIFNGLLLTNLVNWSFNPVSSSHILVDPRSSYPHIYGLDGYVCHPVGHWFWGFRSLNRVLIFICLILKYGDGFRLINSKQESKISRWYVLPELNHAIVTFVRGDFSGKISCVSASRRLRGSGSVVFHGGNGENRRLITRNLDWKSWTNPEHDLKSWIQIPTRNEREWAHSPLHEILTRNPTRNTNSRSASKIGQPSCASYIFTKLYLVSILNFNRWINKGNNMKLLVSFGIRSPHHQTISSPKKSPSRIIYLVYTYQKEKSLKENS